VNRKFVLPFAVVIGLVLVGGSLQLLRQGDPTGAATGAGGCGQGGLAELQEEADTRTDIRVVEAELATTLDPADEIVAGRYVMRLDVDVEQGEGGTINTGKPDLDGVLQTQVGELRPLGRAGLWSFTSELGLEELQDQLEDDEDVAWVEPVILVSPLDVPNDTYFPYQWHLATLDIGGAHDLTTGTGAVVAVVDSGVSEGSDGFGNLLDGYDFFDDDDDPSDSDAGASDSGSHGTHVAGTIAQSTNNNRGTAGLAPGASILPVRALGLVPGYGIVGYSDDIADAIVWAADNGANVINLSLGSSSYSSVIDEACQYAVDQGVLVVAAAGNDGAPNGVSYPGALDATLAVAATDLNHEVSYYSNGGPEIDLSAPGGDVTADLDGDGYGDGVLQETTDGSSFFYSFFQGTSMAAPHVAAAAALAYANGITDVDDLRSALLETAEDLGASGPDNVYGYGLVDPVAAMTWTPAEETEEVLELQIESLSARSLSRRRARITWVTSEAADTEVGCDNGSQRSSTTLSTSHRVVLRGQRNSTTTCTVTSTTADGRSASDDIEVSF